MSEDDRAAKAARARALLKKKQQQKAAGGGSIASPTVASPVLPPSRAFSPAPSEITLVNPEDQRAGRNVGDLFSGGQLGDGGGDISWLSGLNRVDAHLPLATASTSPPAVSSPAPVVSHGAATPEATSTVASGQGELHAKIAELNTIVSALEAEKHGLKDVVERLKETETNAQRTQKRNFSESKPMHSRRNGRYTRNARRMCSSKTAYSNWRPVVLLS
ncbi:uncharacterized protein C8Q71DRAFT_595746 [Rhodofomes roseus]|uniref:Uncharacterized protein n=1 Tax=Rhodofomes roseus TaxID=34475 RepID=A0ABQ8KHJ9_9APHY|nr:uncharacterized protein C8Q71DRAFT_595746 [Rhodofomes roseus]KAH9837308.1 hypothetical protein C8Q71DRAFT_595746 [Rhodofomes roseus]